MRPTSEELLRGIKDAIEEYIVPDLSSPYPMAVAGLITALLDHLVTRIDNEGELLAQSNVDIRACLEAVRPMIREKGKLQEELDRQHPVNDGFRSVVSLRKENNALREVLIEVLRSLDAGNGELGLDRGSEIRKEIIDCSKRQLDRELSLLEPLEAYFATLYHQKSK